VLAETPPEAPVAGFDRDAMLDVRLGSQVSAWTTKPFR
jgi:hypothetical protein